MEKRSFKKEAEIEFKNDEYNTQSVKWTIMYDSNDPSEKYLKLYVDGKKYDNWGNKLESYVFGKESKQPRTLFTHITDWLYELIMHKDNAYDLFHDEKIERMIKASYC